MRDTYLKVVNTTCKVSVVKRPKCVELRGASKGAKKKKSQDKTQEEHILMAKKTEKN